MITNDGGIIFKPTERRQEEELRQDEKGLHRNIEVQGIGEHFEDTAKTVPYWK